jgi:hypothetical protein
MSSERCGECRLGLGTHNTRDPLCEARLTEDQLRARANGCTELSCLYHGVFNIELMRRHEES